MKTKYEEIYKLIDPEHTKLKDGIFEKIEKIYSQYRVNENVIELINGINWKNIIKVFDDNYEKLYQSFGLTNIQSGLYANRIYFKRKIYNILFDRIVLILLTETYNQNKQILNKIIIDEIKLLFNIYKMQHFIEQFDKENLMRVIEKDKEITNREFEKLRLDAELGVKFRGGKQNPDEINVFKKILVEYNNNKVEGKYISLKSLTIFYGKKDLKLGLDDDHKSELENLYKRFNTYKKKLSHFR